MIIPNYQGITIATICSHVKVEYRFFEKVKYWYFMDNYIGKL